MPDSEIGGPRTERRGGSRWLKGLRYRHRSCTSSYLLRGGATGSTSGSPLSWSPREARDRQGDHRLPETHPWTLQRIGLWGLPLPGVSGSEDQGREKTGASRISNNQETPIVRTAPRDPQPLGLHCRCSDRASRPREALQLPGPFSRRIADRFHGHCLVFRIETHTPRRVAVEDSASASRARPPLFIPLTGRTRPRHSPLMTTRLHRSGPLQSDGAGAYN